MTSKIFEVKTEKNKLKTTFFNGFVKEYDLKEANILGELSDVLESEDEVAKVEVSSSRDYIIWPNGTKISSETLFYEGVDTAEHIDHSFVIKFADRMRCVRESLGLSQKELQNKTGIYQADLSKIERGEGNPSLETIEKISKALNLDLQFFAMPHASFKHFEPIPEDVALFLPKGKIQGEFVVADLDALPEGKFVELIDGCVCSMAVPSSIHQQIIGEMFFAFKKYIKENKGQCVVFGSSTGLRFENDDSNYLIPDMTVVCDRNKITSDGIVGSPDFVLEVASPSNYRYDYHKKTQLYMDNGVREYWIIDPMLSRLTVYNFDNYGIPEVHTLDEVVPVSIYDGKLEIDMREIIDFMI